VSKFHCGKLCECNTCNPLRWALDYARDERRAEIFRQFPPQTGNTGDLQEEYEAICAILDPAKLGELYLLALRPRWFVDSNHLRLSYYVHPITKAPMIGIWWTRHCENADCDMPTARARLASIMRTDPAELSFAICDRILKGET
jgi:hypothetical protein